GVEPHTVYALIERGELHAEVIYPHARPRQRRSFHITRRDVDDYLERARVKPGELRHLHPNWTWDRYGEYSDPNKREDST
ncbi:MAG: helix-turn-helix domain-containing protein, partial [Actinomycetota bacterium]|nr:helix-turn-helix domain-containing protein [Actinomycetota bacterium]